MPRQAAIPMPTMSAGIDANIRSVECIIDEAEDGFFYSAARLIIRILRDDRIYSVLMTRIYGLLGKHLDFEPGKDTAMGRKVAEEIETLWPYMFKQSSLVQLITWGLMLGIGIAQIVETPDGWHLEVWHPGNLRWDAWNRKYFIRARDEELEISQEGDRFVDKYGRKWVLFTPYGYDTAGASGLFGKLGMPYVQRQEGLRDRSRYSEMHGQPTRFGIAPLLATAEELEAYERRLSPMGAEPVVVARQGEDGNKWDMKLVEATGKSQDLFAQEIAQLDKAVATLVLGQSQSTDGQAGLGSNDQAGEPVRLEYMRADRDSVCDCLHAQVLAPYCEFAYGSAELAPWPLWQVDPPEDKAARAKVHLDQANADVAYINVGVLTPEEVALSRFGNEGEYSLDTEIDTETRQAIKDLSAEQMKIEAEKALEDAKNPPEPVIAPGQPNGTNGAKIPTQEMPA